MNWKALTKTAKRTLSRNSSKILLGLGIAGAFTAVGFAITATPKAMILLDEKKKELGVEKLDAKTIVKTAAPVYIPTAISMAVSTGCIIGASSVNDRRNAALAAAYTMSETALRSYQDKVAATIGEDKAQEIKEAVALDKMAKCPEPDEIPTAKNLAPDDVSYDKKVKCWESLSGKYFWTTRNAIYREYSLHLYYQLQRRPQPRPLRLQQAPGQSGSDRRHGASSDGHGRNDQADPSESGKDL